METWVGGNEVEESGVEGLLMHFRFVLTPGGARGYMTRDREAREDERERDSALLPEEGGGGGGG